MNKERILMLATTPSMIKHFNMRNIRILQELGSKVFVGTNFKNPGSITLEDSNALKKNLEENGVVTCQIDFKRKIGSPISNYEVIKQIKKVINSNQITGIHAQSPLGGVLGRIAAHLTSTPVIYTAHGFQFFRGGPKKDWILYYPVERFLANWCHAIITINSNDFKIAQNFNTKVYQINGVGANIKQPLSISEKKRKEYRDETRKKLNIGKEDFLILSVGELNNNKNHQLVIRAISRLNNKRIKYVIAGVGENKKQLLYLINELHLEKQVKLLGYVNNLDGLYFAADLNAFVSKREGLGLGGLDGVAHRLYIIGNGNTGMRDYIPNNKIGLMINNPEDVDELAQKISIVLQNRPTIVERDCKFLYKFDYDNVDQKMKKIYSESFFNK